MTQTDEPAAVPAGANGSRKQRRAAMRVRYFPEAAIDGFSRVDSAVEFYTRVNALAEPDMTVVDFGAGRAQWTEDTSGTRKRLRDLRGRVAKVVGVDVDPVVLQNPAMDEKHVIEPGGRLPFDDASIGLIMSDFTFEHIDDPVAVAAELERVLRPGGWVCARTPNKRGYIGLGARAVPNEWHVRWLTRLQPQRKDIDVFPVRYRMNTRDDLLDSFPADRWNHVVYTMPGEPNYAGGSRWLWSVVGFVLKLQPRAVQPMMLIFLQKKG